MLARLISGWVARDGCLEAAYFKKKKQNIFHKRAGEKSPCLDVFFCKCCVTTESCNIYELDYMKLKLINLDIYLLLNNA